MDNSYQSISQNDGATGLVEMPNLSPKELKERSFDLYRLFQISQVRESAHPQFDGMGYSRYNESNEMADISYLAPKVNKGDSRITTGITHEKDSSLVSFFLNLNFEGTVRVFYKDKENIDIGSALTKLVRKSREEEQYDRKRNANYRNFVAQGTSFILEEYVEEWRPDKKLTGTVNPLELSKTKWVNKGFKKVKQGYQTTLIDGKKVFLENIREADIQKQPGVYIVEYVSREILESQWKKNPRWKNVPWTVTPTATSLGTLAQGSIYSDWIWGEIDFTKCEVIRVYRPFEQRFQIYINGVPMLPCEFPLQAVSPSGGIPIAKGDIDLMNMFAYSKSEPAKTKIDQSIFDEVLQNMIRKFRQSAQVPRANNSSRVLTPDMFDGGRITANIDPKEVPPLIENPGITSADFSFYELFKAQIDAKTISSLIEGNPIGGDMTLGQYMDMQKKQMLKLGGKIDGIIQWEKQMLRLRVANILAHGYDKKEITTEDTMSDGTKGLSIFKLTEENYGTAEDVFNEEVEYEKENGQFAEITYLNPKLMKEMLEDPDYYFCYEIVPVDKNNDKLAQVMFVSMVTQAMELFGPDSLQVSNLKKQYAQVMGKSFDDIFLSEEELELKQMEQQQAMQAEAEAQMAEESRGGSKPRARGKQANPIEQMESASNPLVDNMM
jgi:hypothetical protein